MCVAGRDYCECTLVFWSDFTIQYEMSTSSITTVTSLLVRVHDGSRLGKVVLANHAHYVAPIYAASKSGLVSLYHSHFPLPSHGIRSHTFHPIYVGSKERRHSRQRRRAHFLSHEHHSKGGTLPFTIQMPVPANYPLSRTLARRDARRISRWLDSYCGCATSLPVYLLSLHPSLIALRRLHGNHAPH